MMNTQQHKTEPATTSSRQGNTNGPTMQGPWTDRAAPTCEGIINALLSSNSPFKATLINFPTVPKGARSQMIFLLEIEGYPTVGLRVPDQWIGVAEKNMVQTLIDILWWGRDPIWGAVQ